jgi:two-component system cell cycle sensor histidine kinase/response regulator CckA
MNTLGRPTRFSPTGRRHPSGRATLTRATTPLGRIQVGAVVVAVATMTALAALDAAAGPGVVLAGLLAAGPGLAAVSGYPRAVLAVGGYAVTLISVLAWWPDGIFATYHHLLYLLATVAVTLVGYVLARRVRQLERFAERAQAPLRTLAALVAGSGDAIIGKTLDGTVTTWNPGAERMYGYTAAEMVGTNISVIAGRAGSDEFIDVLARIAAGERIDHYDSQRRRKDGTLLDVSLTVSPIRDGRGVVVGTSAVARDISARKRAEERQRETDEYLRTLAAIVESSEDAIIALALDGTVTVWNLGAERLYGFTAAETVGLERTTIDGLMPGPEVAVVIAQVVAGRHAEHYETTRTHKDGTPLDVSVSLSPIHDADGVVVGVSAVVRDITARKHAEARQREIDERTQLAQRLQSLGQLASGVAHDFNNLLAIISNFTSFVIEHTVGDEVAQADLAQVSAAADRAAGLTRQMLLFTRGESSRAEVLDVNASIAEAHALLARTIGANIELVAVPSAEPLMICADSGRIQQVLINLAVNARDAMPDGGTLVIEGAMAELDEYQTGLQPALQQPGRYVRLLVSDTGTGMSKEVAARIFEPFYTTKPTGKGTGLGLATVHGIVTEAGGSLNVYSEPHLGTTFRAYFPVADKQSRQASTTPDSVEPPHGAGQTIIVVDDEDAIRQVVQRILDKAGYHVLVAGSGPAALEMDAQSHCRILVTDVVMPGMSGRRLTELMRRRHPGLPVLYMSGYSDGLRETEPFDGQDIGFIEKPFTARGLLQQIHVLLASSEAGTSAAALDRARTAPVVA